MGREPVKRERWTEQDVALVGAKRAMKHAVATPRLEPVIGRTYSFTVPGLAQPGGSKKAFALYDKKKICKCGPHPGYVPLRRENGSIIINITDDNDARVSKWKKWVARVAREEYPGPLFDGFLRVTFVFYQPRPQDHYTSTGKLSKHGIETPWPNVKPDTTKLVRATEDALREICYTDDAIIVKQSNEKEYGTPARVEITIEELVLPAQTDQVSLFGDLEAPAPWEIKGSAAGRQQRARDSEGQADGAARIRDTSDAGKNHNGHNQTQAIDGPPPWDDPDQVEPAKKEKRSQAKSDSVTRRK